MIDRIVSIGCSHMYGSEIYGPETLEYSTPESRELTFAGQVAKEFDLLHIDLSTPGGSNTHIRETAIEWIAEQGNRSGLHCPNWLDTLVDITFITINRQRRLGRAVNITLGTRL